MHGLRRRRGTTAPRKQLPPPAPKCPPNRPPSATTATLKCPLVTTDPPNFPPCIQRTPLNYLPNSPTVPRLLMPPCFLTVPPPALYTALGNPKLPRGPPNYPREPRTAPGTHPKVPHRSPNCLRTPPNCSSPPPPNLPRRDPKPLHRAPTPAPPAPPSPCPALPALLAVTATRHRPRAAIIGSRVRPSSAEHREGSGRSSQSSSAAVGGAIIEFGAHRARLPATERWQRDATRGGRCKQRDWGGASRPRRPMGAR